MTCSCRRQCESGLVILVWAIALAGSARGQDYQAPSGPFAQMAGSQGYSLPGNSTVMFDPAVTPVDCPGCQQAYGGLIDPMGGQLGMVGMPAAGGACATCVSGCVPGHARCPPSTAHTTFGRFFYGIYQAICCNDHCYEPHWTPLADAAFFCESARPQTQNRVRWDAGLNARCLDMAEYFFARADGSGKGPKPVGAAGIDRAAYHELSLYTEVGNKAFSMFFNMPYRLVYPSNANFASGMGDMDMGTKSLMFDTELLQIAFQFRTFIMVGDASKGLGTGHISLEPSLLTGLNLGPTTFLQGQFAEWIPIAGDSNYGGSIFHFHLSLNQVLCYPVANSPLIVTYEFNGYAIQHGEYTDYTWGPIPASNYLVLTTGPGIRFVICDKVDFGIGTSFALTERHYAGQLIRCEYRWRY